MLGCHSDCCPGDVMSSDDSLGVWVDNLDVFHSCNGLFLRSLVKNEYYNVDYGGDDDDDEWCMMMTMMHDGDGDGRMMVMAIIRCW